MNPLSRCSRRGWWLDPRLLLVGLLFAAPTTAGDWHPVTVDVWDPPFNTERQRRQQRYEPLERATEGWNICVSIPHLKDSYWLAANFGLVDEARRLGVNLAIYEAGGYDRLEVQREQVRECLLEGFASGRVDGFILSAVDANGLNDLIAQMHTDGIPVVDLINGINSTYLAGRAAASYYDLGHAIGRYLLALNPASAGAVNVAWFPGPAAPVWATSGNEGFRAALAGSHVNILAMRHGDTGKTMQAKLVEEVLDELGEAAAARLDYIVGTTVSAEAAVSVLRRRGLDDIRVLSYYYGSGVHQAIKRGTVLAAPTDSTVLLARIAVDMVTRVLEGELHLQHVAPEVVMVDRASLTTWDATTTLAPRGFRPMFSVGKQ